MPNYDTIEDTASYHGTKIKTGIPSQKYKDNWDKIFNNKKLTKEELVVLVQQAERS